MMAERKNHTPFPKTLPRMAAPAGELPGVPTSLARSSVYLKTLRNFYHLTMQRLAIQSKKTACNTCKRRYTYK
jgi:hypothetical protein